jgi:hypothetical protein
VLGAFIEGFNLGTWLDERLCISEGFGDALTYGADDHAIEQFIENRERRGRDATLFDLLEFADRCGGGGPMTAYCAGFAP